METITGTITKVFYESQDNDFKVFTIKKKDRSIIRVTGEFPQIMHGVTIELHGEFKTHPKYGPAFKASAHAFTYDKNAESICLYIQSIAKWVGPQRSYAIAEKFGGDIENIIENTPERLMEIEGIGEKIALSISDAWKLNTNLKDIQIFLHGLGLSPMRIRRVINMFGAETEKILTDNPWKLCGHGFGFTTCDHIAGKLGKNMSDGFRYKQFILYTLKTLSSSGHLFLYPDQLVAAFNKYNAKADYPFKGGDITLVEIAPYVKELINEAELINDKNRIYELTRFFFENESARLLVKTLNTPSPCKLNISSAQAFLDRYEKQNTVDPLIPFKLSDMQADAIRSFFTEKVMIITGPPGSGKTLTLRAFVQIMKENGISFELMAPTGIAAKKLSNTAGHDAYTIHRRLGYKGDQWDYNNTNKYATDVVIVDEGSMVDQEVFYRLISALYSRTKIVFVGDNDQLPSVGPGSVLKQLIDSNVIKTIFLNKIFRQDKTSEIILEAKKIRDGDTDLTYFRSEKEADIWHISDKEESRIENIIIRFAQQLKAKAKEKSQEKNKITFQILTPRNEGPLSVFSLNAALQGALNPHVPDSLELKLEDCVIRKGDRILIKKNNYEYEVFNGDVGKVALITPYSVLIDIDDLYGTSRRIDLPIKIAEDMLKLAYSLTIHKCLPKGTLVYTNTGVKKIEVIDCNDLVYTHKGRYKKVLWSGKTDDNTTIQINTRTGSCYNTSPEHGLLVSNGGYPTFKKAEEVNVGDYICNTHVPFEGVDIPLEFVNTQFQDKKVQIKIPTLLDEDLSWVIGVIIGDGNCTDTDDGVIDVGGPTKIAIIERFNKIINSYGVSTHEHNRKGKRYSTYTCSKNLRDFFYSLGLEYVIARNKKIPDIFYTCRIRERCSFIAGLFDTDGSVNKMGMLRYRTASSELAYGLKELLHSIGIISFVKEERPYSFLVSIFGVDTINFRNMIKLTHPKKKKLLDDYVLFDSGKTNHYEIPYGKEIVEQFLINFQNKEGESRGIKGKGLLSKYKSIYIRCRLVIQGKNKMRYPLLQALEQLCKNEGVEIPPLMKQCIEDNYYFDIVNSKNEILDKVPMYDLEIEDDHSYSTPHFICHNSQGSEYSIVIIPLIKAHGTLLLQRNLLYTAITRAKKKVVLIGQTSAIEQAIKNDKIQMRNTLLAERVTQWKQGTGISLRNMFSQSSASQINPILNRLLLLEGGSS